MKITPYNEAAEYLKVSRLIYYQVEGTLNCNTHYQIRDDSGKLVWILKEHCGVI
jgi:hypothetical protein